jgi:hypothetical protein
VGRRIEEGRSRRPEVGSEANKTPLGNGSKSKILKKDEKV